MRVLVADDDMSVRSALRLLLEQEPGISVAGEVTNYSELSQKVKEMKPDLILLDWQLTGGHNTEFLEAMQQELPGTRVVVLSSQPDNQKRALSQGAIAFVCKEEPPERLIKIIRRLNSPYGTDR